MPKQIKRVQKRKNTKRRKTSIKNLRKRGVKSLISDFLRFIPNLFSKKTKHKKRKIRKIKPGTGRKSLKFLSFIVKIGFIALIWGIVIVAIIISAYSYDLPNTNKLINKTKTPTIRIITTTGKSVASYGDNYGNYLEYEDFPPYLIQAVLATEDRRFFNHFGVDIIGLLRATYINIKAKRVVQGGSTITQQLAKIAFLNPDRTLKRKIQEMVLALWLERRFSKKEILTIYLNRAYLGAGNYGVDSAAKGYFGKSAKNLTLGESAIIAGLLRAPSRYAPSNNPDLAIKRAKQVLINMSDSGFISHSKALAEAKKVKNYSMRKGHNNLYFADWIVEQLPNYIGNTQSDITVVTTLDLDLQNKASKVLKKHLDENKEKKVMQGALISTAADGRVLAMIGGVNYRKSQFNRAVQAKRQPGSAFKLFVYLTALEHGFLPDSEIEDKPVELNGWTPENYSEEFNGLMTLSEALARSINSVAVQLGQEVGVKNIIQKARQMGITSDLMAIPSAVLGTNEVTLFEMVRAYNAMPNDGQLMDLYGILRIQDNSGNILYEKHYKDEPPQVADTDEIRKMNGMLVDVVKYGTARFANIGRPAGGKTGTSQNHRDAWFIGFTPQITTGVWVGNDNNSPMSKEMTGGTITARIWKDFMEYAHINLPVKQIPTSSWAAPQDPFDFMDIFGGNKNKSDLNGNKTEEQKGSLFKFLF